MTRYWIKLWVDALGDTKMARLPDAAWRLFVECCMLAGIEDKGGLVGTTEDIAWALRRDPATVQHNLEILARQPSNPKQHPLMCNTPEGWVVTRFEARQAPVNQATRQQMSRAARGPDATNKIIASDPADLLFRRAEEVYQKVTRQITIPSDNLDECVRVLSLHLREHGGDIQATADALLPVFIRWTQTKGKGGRAYAPTNTTWLTNWSTDKNAATSGGNGSASEPSVEDIRKELTNGRQDPLPTGHSKGL